MNSLLVGREIRPRVRRSPLGVVSNDAGDACFLARSYGLTPDEWQADVLADWLGRRADGRWAAPNCGLAVARQNGKNGVIEVRELFGMVVLGEKFLHTAHEVKTARKAFIRLCSFFENEQQYPELAAMVTEIRRTNGQEAIVLNNGGSIEFIARSRGSGRGFTVDVLVLDEAQDLTSEELAALLPTISAAPLKNPQTILTGTPPVKKTSAKGEVFRGLRTEGEHGQSEKVAWTDFGVADGPMPDVTDRAIWYETNPTLGDRLDIEAIEAEFELMAADPEGFARERLGWWGDPEASQAGVFGSGRWAACYLEVDLASLKPEAIGIAVSVDRLHASIAAATTVSDLDPEKPGEMRERTMVAAVKRADGTGWTVDEAARIQREYECVVAIDEKGPTKDSIKDLEEGGVNLELYSLDEYAEACAWIFDRVQSGELAQAGSKELNEAVDGATWRMVGDRQVWGRRGSRSDVSMLEAATLAGHAASYRRTVYRERGLHVF